MADKGRIKLTESERKMQTYLSDYSVFRRIWERETSEKDHFGNPRKIALLDEMSGENTDVSTEARVKMFEIRRFVTSLPSCDEKLFLFLRYIHGETMESCAEKLGISPRQLFRMHKIALSMACDVWERRGMSNNCKE